MRKAMRQEEDAIVQVVEFILVFTVFLILLSAFFAALSTQFPEGDFDNIGSEMKVRSLAMRFVRETGMTANGDTDWESHTSGELNYGSNGLKRLGFAASNLTPNELSLGKITALRDKLTYGLVTSILDLGTGFMINLTFIPLDDDDAESYYWGAHRTSRSTSASSYQRMVEVVDHSSTGIEREGSNYRMTVTIFRNGEI